MLTFRRMDVSYLIDGTLCHEDLLGYIHSMKINVGDVERRAPTFFIFGGDARKC